MKNVKLTDTKLNTIFKTLKEDGIVYVITREKIEDYENLYYRGHYVIRKMDGTYQLSRDGVFEKHIIDWFKKPLYAVNYFKGKEILMIK